MLVQTSPAVFARTGSLGGPELGQPRWEAVSRFGRPTDWAIGTPESRASVWGSGDVELRVDADDRVSLIHCDNYRDVSRGGGGLSVDPWVICAGLPLGRLARAMYHADSESVP